MIKLVPYWLFDIPAIERWLDHIAEQGYCLTRFNDVFCVFKQVPGARRYYRIRYLPDQTPTDNMLIWKDLCIFWAHDESQLPSPNHDGDAKHYATLESRLHQILFPAFFVFLIISDLIPNIHVGTEAMWIGICAVLCWALRLVEDGIRWLRARRLASGSITATGTPPHKNKLISNLSLIPAIFALLLYFLM